MSSRTCSFKSCGRSERLKPLRRKKVQKEELPEDIELYRDPATTLYYTNQGIEDAVPVLLVDGYNVCGYWVKLKKVKVVVVFDAMMSGLPTHKETFAGIDIVYSGESCADAWIEKELDMQHILLMSSLQGSSRDDASEYVREYWRGLISYKVASPLLNFMHEGIVSVMHPALGDGINYASITVCPVVALKEDGCPKLWVVTSDNCQQQAAHGAVSSVLTVVLEWSIELFIGLILIKGHVQGAFVWSSKVISF
ncbi:serine/threonine-protein kinase SRK2B isoform 1 [Hibiscus syriacus]|uniref:Serine/threonine-protein kinase SRK2B isoform 1 n=1 Tax=Hibiscus syriacus TaxID=106335 RepID=A0A6A2X2Y4_HIBSY|nr:serine/threonine-protein kinase SRK2B isoform 1 [Hibiscus syriacus]